MQPVAPLHPPFRSAMPADEPPAGLGRRFLAGAIDAAAAVALGGWLVLPWWLATARAAATGEQPPAAGAGVAVGLAVMLIVAAAQWVLHGRTGATLGRFALGIRTLDVETRRPIGVGRVLVRGLVVAAGALVLGVGQVVVLLSPLLDRTGRRRGWHDLVARDEVLVVRGTSPAGPRGAHAWDAAEPGPVRREVPAGPAEPATVTSPVRVPRWAAAQTGGTEQLAEWFDDAPSLVLAPVTPARSGPDLDTRALPIVRAAAAAPTAPPVPATGLDPELELTRPAPRRPDVRVAPARTRPVPTAAEFELSDGRRLTVERTALVGRNPATVADVQLVRVVDPARSVSKTHLQVGVEPGGVWVADRGSTNGTVVTLPGGGQVVCQVDHQVRLRVGATVVFGDCWMRLVRAPESAGVS
ncbi:RDD family protein [Cellulomonas fimi]|uniref:RDD family protein n=1 Tax=Cellulomonas fimi TaxID=1708 RepID=UPI00234C48CB|nr:RDD family protein [Cellulomonas fimi]MDC7121069.1 RDD family protein [Cellulomonas fimi]